MVAPADHRGAACIGRFPVAIGPPGCLHRGSRRAHQSSAARASDSVRAFPSGRKSRRRGSRPERRRCSEPATPITSPHRRSCARTSARPPPAPLARRVRRVHVGGAVLTRSRRRSSPAPCDPRSGLLSGAAAACLRRRRRRRGSCRLGRSPARTVSLLPPSCRHQLWRSACRLVSFRRCCRRLRWL